MTEFRFPPIRLQSPNPTSSCDCNGKSGDSNRGTGCERSEQPRVHSYRHVSHEPGVSLFRRPVAGVVDVAFGSRDRRPVDTPAQDGGDMDLSRHNRDFEAEQAFLTRVSSRPDFPPLIAEIKKSVSALVPSAPWGLGSGLGSGAEQPWSPPIENIAFNPKKFHDLLIAKMSQVVAGVGYAFVITTNKGGYASSYADGFARRGNESKDSKPRLMTIDQPVNTASVGKVITAAAVLKALESWPGLSLEQALDQPIAKYFPSHWLLSPLFKKMTFRNCLEYRIGNVTQWNGGVGTEWGNIKQWRQEGLLLNTVLQPWMFGEGEPSYNNVCYALFRYVLFYLTAGPSSIKSCEEYALMFGEKRDGVLNYLASTHYAWYAKTMLLDPIGVKFADLNHVSQFWHSQSKEEQAAAQTLYYTYPFSDSDTGRVGWDWTPIGGGGGWIISARDLARFWAHLRYGNLLSKAATDKIFPKGDTVVPFATGTDTMKPYGQYYIKGGGANEGGNGSGYVSFILDFPGDIQLSIVVNHSGVYAEVRDQVIFEAYQAAWLP